MKKALCILFLGASVFQATRSLAHILPFAFWRGHNYFVWMGGSDKQSLTANYGTKGTGSTANRPGARSGAYSWVDGSGNYWVFGGNGFDVNGDIGPLNDLWKYTPANGQWTWISGSNVNYQQAVPGTYGVPGAANTPSSRDNGSAWTDSSGNLWLFGGFGVDNINNARQLSDLWKFDVSLGQWTWVSGTRDGDSSGVFGTKGVASTANFPSGRQSIFGGLDSAGNVWIFGGWGKDSTGGTGRLNDLWRYTPGTDKWAWMAGSSTNSGSATYGTKGVGSTSNIISARAGSTGWFDSSGNVWLFGGSGPDSASNVGMMNDLWKFSPGTSQWTWVSGSNVRDQSGTYGALGAGSAGYSPGGRASAAAFKDSSGKFWFVGGSGVDSASTQGNLNDIWKFDPTTSQWTWVSGSNLANQNGTPGTAGTGSTSNALSGRGTTAAINTSSGVVWIFGGSGQDTAGATSAALGDFWSFNTANLQMTWVGGLTQNLQSPRYGTKGTGATGNIPGGRSQQVSWTDSSGNFWLFGGNGIDSTGDQGYLQDLWKYSPSTQTWTWISGNNVDNQGGSYGSKGTGSTANLPGARVFSTGWVDASDNLWLFGGYGPDSGGSWGSLSDLWKFNPTNLQWTWVSGSKLQDQSATYGTKGVSAAANIPGPRDLATSWIDSSGNLWLFGGTAKDSAGIYDYANDLWKFNPTSLQWTWVAGSNLRNQNGTYGTQGAGSTGNTPGARNAVATWTDGSGTFWLFGGLGYDGSGGGGYLNDLWKFNPGTLQWTWVSGASTVGANGTFGTRGVSAAGNVPSARQNAFAWKDASGNLWLFGGYGNDSAGTVGPLGDLWRYSPTSGQWTWIAGSNLANQSGTYGTLGVPSFTNVPGAGSMGGAWADKNGAGWIFGGFGDDSNGVVGTANHLWKFVP